MKKMNVLLIAVALTVSSVLSASTTPINADEPQIKLSKQISQLLEKPGFDVQEDIMAEVTFMITEDQEIVVLTVDTKSEYAESFIKNRLNYQKVVNTVKGGEYNVPIRILARS